jgi:hypothetical protein
MMRYVFQGSITYLPPEPITAAAEKNCAEKKASVVTRVSQPKMLIHPTQKLTGLRHLSVLRDCLKLGSFADKTVGLHCTYAKWYCPPAVGHILAISPKLAPMQRLQSTQRIKPYKKATEPPDGITIPKLPARHIHVLVPVQSDFADMDGRKGENLLQYRETHAHHSKLR